jgi:hypothetical protein
MSSSLPMTSFSNRPSLSLEVSDTRRRVYENELPDTICQGGPCTPVTLKTFIVSNKHKRTQLPAP